MCIPITSQSLKSTSFISVGVYKDCKRLIRRDCLHCFRDNLDPAHCERVMELETRVNANGVINITQVLCEPCVTNCTRGHKFAQMGKCFIFAMSGASQLLLHS